MLQATTQTIQYNYQGKVNVNKTKCTKCPISIYLIAAELCTNNYLNYVV